MGTFHCQLDGLNSLAQLHMALLRGQLPACFRTITTGSNSFEGAVQLAEACRMLPG